MSDIIYPAGIYVDEATKARTEELFEKTIIMTKDRGVKGYRPKEGRISDDDLANIIKQGICLEARDYGGNTPLIAVASKTDKAQSICALIAAGADVNAQHDHGNTALMAAVLDGSAETIPILLAAGASIETRSKSKTTAFNYAAIHRRNDKIPYLLKRGANIYAQDSSGRIFDSGPTADRAFEWVSEVQRLQNTYDSFITMHTPPINAQETYDLLAATPLAERMAPVDYVGNLRKIFMHAKWENKEQARNILSEMKEHGSITVEIADSIFASTFPQENLRMQSRTDGRGR